MAGPALPNGQGGATALAVAAAPRGIVSFKRDRWGNKLSYDDDLKTEYHLTPDGWVTGTHRCFGKISDGNEVERPQNAVETWERHIVQRSRWSPEEKSARMLWYDASVPKAEREALNARFTRPF